MVSIPSCVFFLFNLNETNSFWSSLSDVVGIRQLKGIGLKVICVTADGSNPNCKIHAGLRTSFYSHGTDGKRNLLYAHFRTENVTADLLF